MAKEFTYKMNIDAEIGALLSKLKTVKTSLANITSDGKEAPIARSLESIATKIDSIKARASTPIRTEATFGNLIKDTRLVDSNLDKLKDKLLEVAKKSAQEKIQFLPENEQKRLNDIINTIKNYDATIERSGKATKELTAAENKRLSAERQLAKAQQTLANAQEALPAAKEARDAAKAALDEAKARSKAADAAQDLYDKIQKLAQARKKDNSKLDLRSEKFEYENEEGKKQTTTISGAAQKRDQARALSNKDDLQALRDAYQTAGQAVDSLNTRIGNANSSIEIQTKAVDQATKEWTELNAAFEANKAAENAKAFADMRQQAQELGVSLEGIGTENSAENIDLLKQRMNECVESGIIPVNQTVQENVTYIEELKTSNEGLRGSIEKNIEAFRQENDTAGQVDGLMNRIKQFTGITGVALVMRRALRSAIQTTKELDKQMTEMAVVTDLEVGDYWKQLPQHTEQANKLGVAIKDVYEAETLYYQQGLKTAQVQKLSTSTLKMARIAGLSAEDATNKMTAALRGFNMEINETNADRIADVYSKLAAITASNVKEISSAMTKTASLASNAGMEFETTAAFLAQIIETTRESAETAGTALKTVIARFQELKKSPDEIGEVEGEIVDANKIETALRTVGVALRDTQGQFRNLDEVFLELSSKWDTLDTNTQRYIATIAAGSRQQSRFIAMMSDYARTQELVNAANTAAGASNEQFEKTLQSLQSKLAQLKNAWDTFTQGLANNVFIKAAVSLLTGFLNILNKLTKGFGNFTGSALKIGVVTAALIAGDRAIRIFTQSLKRGTTAMGAFGNVFTAAGQSIKNFGTRLLTSIRNLTTNNKTLIVGKKVIKDYSAAENKLTAATKASAQEKVKRDGAEAALDHTLKNKNATMVQVTKAQRDYDAVNAQYTASVKAQKDAELELMGTLGLSEAQQQTYNELKLAGLPTDQAAILASKGISKAKLEEGASISGLTTEELAAIITQRAETKTKLGGVLASKLASLALKMESKGKIGAAIASKLYAAANWVATASLGMLLVAILAVVAAIALLVLAIIGIVALFKKMKAESPEGRLKAAEEQLKRTTEAANEASEAYKSLRDGLSDLKDKYKNLDDLVVGTEAWRDALIEVNGQVMDLIEKYPTLAQGLTVDANGVMRISDEAMLAAQREAAMQVARTNNARQLALIRKNNAQLDVSYSKLSSKSVKGNQGLGTFGGVLSGAAIAALPFPLNVLGAGLAGAKIHGAGSGNSWFNVLAGLDPLTGAIRGGFEGNFASRQANREATDKAASDLITGKGEKGLFSDMLEKMGVQVDTTSKAFGGLASMINKNKEELRQYGAEVEKTKAANEAAMKAMISNSLTMVDATKYTAEELKLMGNMGTKLMESTVRQEQLKLANKRKGDLKNTEYQEYFENIYGKGNVRVGEKGRIIIKDENGRRVLSAGDAKEMYAAAKAGDKMAEKMAVLPKAINNLTRQNRTKGQFVKNAFMEDEGMGLLRDQIGTMSTKNITEWKKIFSDNKELQAIYGKGWAGFNKFIEDMTERQTLAAEAFAENEKVLERIGLKGFEFDNNLTAGAQKGLVEHLSQVVAVSGSEAGEKLGKSINSLLLNVAAEDRDKLAAQLNAIDWHDADALEDLPKTLKELGIALPKDQLDEFIMQAKEAADAVHKIDLAKLNETLVGINKTLKTIREFGQDRLFESDVYETLTKANPDLAPYFRQDLEGKFVFLGDNLDMLSQAIIKVTDDLVAERIKILNNSLGASKIIQQMINSTLGQETVLDVNNWASWSEKDQRNALSRFIENAKDSGTDLTGINPYLSEKTEVAKLDKDQLESILQSLAVLKTPVEIEKELNNEAVQARVTSIQRDNASLNPYAQYLEKVQKGTLSEEERPDFIASRQALLVQAKGIGVSEEDLKRLVQYNTALTELEEQHLTNTRRYKEYVDRAAKAVYQMQTTTSYETLYSGMGENLSKLNELAEAYEKTTEKEHQTFLVAQMMNEFGVQATEDNQATYASYVQALLNGSEVGLQNLINLSGHAIANEENLYEKMNGQEVKWIKAQGDDWEEFMRRMEDAHYGWIETLDDGTQKWHWGLNQAIELAKEYKKEIEGWLNPYDWLYNTNQYINAKLIERNRLERQWKLNLEDNTLGLNEMTQNLTDQIAITEDVVNKYTDIYNEAAAQVEQFVEYVNTQGLEGFAKAFAVGPNGRIVANKQALFGANLTADAGGLGEEEVERITGLIDTMRDAEDQINEANDYLREIRKTGKEEYAALVDRITEALRQQYQREIDTLATINDTITEAADSLTEKIQEKIDDDRQAREQDKKEQELTDKQAQLAYLQASGGNQLEVLQLQKEIGDDQQNYTDSLVDSAINEMTRANQQAADQRQEQIDIAQAQYDFWSEYDAVHDAEQVLNDAILEVAGGLAPEKTGMATLLAHEENRQAKTRDAISEWDQSLDLSTKLATIYTATNGQDQSIQSKINTTNESLGTLSTNLTTAIGETTTAASEIGNKFKDYSAGEEELLTDANLLKTIQPDTQAQEEWWGNELNKIKSGNGTTIQTTEVEKDTGAGGEGGPDANLGSYSGLGPIFDKIQTFINENHLRQGDRNRWGEAFKSAGLLDEYNLLSEFQKEALISAGRDETVHYRGNNFYDLLEERERRGFKADMMTGAEKAAAEIYIDPSKGEETARVIGDTIWDLFRRTISGKKYATGGLADFTGPAWLDGTPTNPELVLNQTDTANFIELKNILAELLRNSSNPTLGGGNNYYDIDVHVDSIDSDYDIDSAAARMKELIEDDAMYRNVNAIQQIR